MLTNSGTQIRERTEYTSGQGVPDLRGDRRGNAWIEPASRRWLEIAANGGKPWRIADLRGG